MTKLRSRPDYRAIITDYKALKSQGNDTWLLDCVKTRDVLHVIEMAALDRDLGNNRHPHQHRVQDVILQQFADSLLKNVEAILTCKTFTQLHDLITPLKIEGIGRLTVYDTAHRIGTRLRVRPDKVYMHQGTRVGSELYLGRKVTERLSTKVSSLTLSTCHAKKLRISCVYTRTASWISRMLRELDAKNVDLFAEPVHFFLYSYKKYSLPLLPQGQFALVLFGGTVE